MLNLQQNKKKALDRNPKMFVNCKQSDVFNLQKVTFFQFYPVYAPTLRASVYPPTTIHLPFGG